MRNLIITISVAIFLAAIWGSICAFIWQSTSSIRIYIRSIIGASAIVSVWLIFVLTLIIGYGIGIINRECCEPIRGSELVKQNIAPEKEVTIYIGKNGIIAVDGKQLPITSLSECIKHRISTEPDLMFVLEADESVSYHATSQILDILGGLHITNITFTVHEDAASP
jgi:biopolymer transport protein ExbD